MITFESISLNFDDKILFENFNHKFEKGSKTLIYGNSGKGKSTLLRMILGFQSEYRGKISFNGTPLSPETINRVRSQCSYVSQDVDLPDDTVKNVIDSIFMLKANRKITPDYDLFNKMAKDFQLPTGLLTKPTSELSGGERQRTGLIIAFMLKRPVLLLDEPTSAVESSMKNTIVSKIMESNKTALIVSHDPEWRDSSEINILEI
ncbi:MAG: ATP-binding cassette domain-containing protein [Spirochaetes bacterium]|nr:ATP-binding cassette domain-containing protein [Spirochaetota bacterium]MBN2771105.1 ATP-binding cassette domain-containing protein [Spirochaetota bacterium]